MNFFTYLFILLICNLSTITLANNITSNIIIIADIHGDIERFRYILQDANVLDKYDRWIAPPNTNIIQLGDQIDPKNNKKFDKKHHFDMIYFTDKLEYIAKLHNSTFTSMIGNHEYYRFDMIQYDNELSSIIAKRPVIKQIGEYLFCHAGFKMSHYLVMRQYNISFKDINNIWFNLVKNNTMTENDTIVARLLITDYDSIIFTRSQDNSVNNRLLFDTIDVKNMFVGHMISKYIHVKNNVWFLDQTLSDAFNNNIYTYITIIDNDIIIKSPRKYWYWSNYFKLIF